MAASQGHPIMKPAVKRVVTALHETAGRNNTSIANFKPSDMEVLQVSGPIIWTHAIIEVMSEAMGTNISYLKFKGMKEPRLFGDAYRNIDRVYTNTAVSGCLLYRSYSRRRFIIDIVSHRLAGGAQKLLGIPHQILFA